MADPLEAARFLAFIKSMGNISIAELTQTLSDKAQLPVVDLQVLENCPEETNDPQLSLLCRGSELPRSSQQASSDAKWLDASDPEVAIRVIAENVATKMFAVGVTSSTKGPREAMMHQFTSGNKKTGSPPDDSAFAIIPQSTS
jgi:hypothetical protein